MWRLIPIIVLMGCPVAPTDVQDVQEQQLPKQGNNMPPANGGQKPNGQGNAQGQQGNMQDQGNMQGQGNTQGQGNMQGQGEMGQGNMQPQEGLEGGVANDHNSSGMPQDMIQNIDDPNMAQNPTAAQDVLPIYEDPPAFDQLIEAGNLAVNGRCLTPRYVRAWCCLVSVEGSVVFVTGLVCEVEHRVDVAVTVGLVNAVAESGVVSSPRA